jgi:hypothetical protein
MTTDVANLQNSGLANLEGMAQSLGNLAQSAAQGGNTFNGRELLKLDKGMGIWVYGQEGVELDTNIVLNPQSFTHGLIAWGDSVVLGERMVPVSQPAPQIQDLPAVAKPYDVQLAFEAAIPGLNTQLIYKTTAHGGKEFVGKVAQAIVEQLSSDPGHPVPEMELTSSSYQHKSWGRIFKPVFKIVAWHAIDAAVTNEPVPEPTPSDAPSVTPSVEPARQRRRRSAS